MMTLSMLLLLGAFFAFFLALILFSEHVIRPR